MNMVEDWLESLRASGFDANLESSGDLDRDARQAAEGTVICPLPHLGLIHVMGDDALPFLHNLLTNDVNGLVEHDLRRAGFCTPKGRMLADFLLWRMTDGLMLQLSADLLPPLLKKLSMYVLRSKAKLSDTSASFARIGLAGPEAATLLAALELAQPQPMQQQAFEAGVVLGLAEQRFEIVIAADKVASLWQRLRQTATPVGVAAWRAFDIAAGVPLITAATSEQFVPQMVNFEAIDGVGFKKGCYPGQEIVARTQYLGKIKRRMYRAHLDAPHHEIGAGTHVFATETGDQSNGMVVSSAPSAQGGIDMLLVTQSSAVEAGQIHVGAPNGPSPQILPLPYAVA